MSQSRDSTSNQVTCPTKRELDELFAQICGFKKLSQKEQALEIKNSGIAETWFHPPKDKRILDTESGDRLVVSVQTAPHYHKDVAKVLAIVAGLCCTNEKAQALASSFPRFCEIYDHDLATSLMRTVIHILSPHPLNPP